jgi:hypothetical protein
MTKLLLGPCYSGARVSVPCRPASASTRPPLCPAVPASGNNTGHADPLARELAGDDDDGGAEKLAQL